MPPLIEAHDLRIRFGAAETVRGVDFHIDGGEVLGLMGGSGSGKSVTALAILGLLGPEENVSGRAQNAPPFTSKASPAGRQNAGSGAHLAYRSRQPA